MKRLYALILALAMALSLAACGSSDSGETEQTDDGAAAETTDDGAAAEVEELTINLYNPVAGEVTDTSYTIFADKVSELSGGKITCNITPAGTLGAEREATQLLLMGDIDMGVFSIDGLDWLVPDVGMSWICLPGLLTSYEEVDEYYNNGWMFERHKEVAAEHGVDLICPGEFGLKVYMGTGEPIRTMDDFKGKIIRIPDVQFHHDYIEALGAMPVSGIDMYTGLQQGTMDAVQNNIPASELFKLEEVIDWITLTWDMYGNNFWVANGDFTASLSDAQREIIYTAAEEAAQYIRDTYREVNDTWVEECRNNPDIEVIDISDEMKAEMQEIGYQIWEEYRDKFDPVAMERIFEEFYPAD
ncbi:TRAP transporter substrate-binding protein [Dysosmobacter sp.]|uniref:TRAP transporter substrate-binding protein n=1 Tax=Dysosmobacter sp. TaxID=2591382 RepID=UPI001BB4866A|nr:TRAP transporter substrate-binding protein [Dysosmobacter sp.]MCI6055691.1 TRAP transporter substrate-binding protein [Dysosmobacter sp.]MDY5509259.1 TRAP transporter substrate-binding protein [Dysosmobacter sp.]QUO38032.1 TRAP transporter substrate-binding protein [Dysosmobacter sp. Marseille-Q4140]